MSRVSTAMSLFLISVLCGQLHGEPSGVGAKLIPLDKIWGFDIPGTKDIRDLEPKSDPTLSAEEYFRRSNVFKIHKNLNQRTKDGERAGQAFVVRGVGKTALENAETAFEKGRRDSTVLPPDVDVSLVFYSQMCGRYVRIKSVETTGNVVRLKYQFVGHATTEATTHFALIPLGKLTAGKYQVEIEESQAIDDRERPEKSVPDPKLFICDSCSFTIKGD